MLGLVIRWIPGIFGIVWNQVISWRYKAERMDLGAVALPFDF